MKSKEMVFYGLILISNFGLSLSIVSTVFEWESMDSTKTCHTGFFDHRYWCTGEGMDDGNLQFGIIALSIFLILIDIGFMTVYYTSMRNPKQQKSGDVAK